MQRLDGKPPPPPPPPPGAFASEPSGLPGDAERRRSCCCCCCLSAAETPAETPDGPGDLAEELREFHAVLGAFHRRCPGGEGRTRSPDAPRRESLEHCDATQSANSPYSFSFSDAKLNSPTLSTPTIASRKGKPGDTKELEDFIADLDRTLASM